ncbi:translocation protein S66 [Ascosphaera pollenicola]|nr:translocation protein S66 [Ascosphaera pollenicola]
MKSLPENERRIIENIVKKYEAEHPEPTPDDTQRLNDAMDEFVADSTSEIEQAEVDAWKPLKDRNPDGTNDNPLGIELKLHEDHKAYILQMNKSLEALRKESTPATRRASMRFYRRCKESIPGFINMMPDEALRLLWTSQLMATDEERRLTRGLMLAEDILKHGKKFAQSQWIDYIQLLSEDGKGDVALHHWRRREAFVDMANSNETNRYWNVGINLLISNDKLAEARAIVFKVLSSRRDDIDYRILIPLIIGYAKSCTPYASEWTWLLYIRLRQSLKDTITMDDYDAISVALLQAGRPHEALAVFKDMMVTHREKEHDSVARYTASVGPWKKIEDVRASDLTKMSLGALTILPKSLANKFFFASWIKKLIGMGEIDNAAKVIELMFERDIRPDAKHLNGLIGAWLRTPGSKNRLKAESLAWSMVQERVDRYYLNKAKQKTEKLVFETYSESDNPLPKHLRRRVPPANIETFCVLLLHYSRRGQEDMVNYLIECLRAARLKPNTFFMNHLLYAELRKEDPLGVWMRFEEMTRVLKPDLESFDCLWHCAKMVYDQRRNVFCEGFPPIRELYKRMMVWYSELSDFKKEATRSQFSKELYDEMLRCFSFTADAHAAVVALHSLKQTFGFVPDSEDVQICVSLLVRIVQMKAHPRARRRSRIINRTSTSIDKVAQVMELVRDQRLAALGKEDVRLEDLTAEEQRLLQVEIVTDSLKVFLNRLDGQSDITDAKIRKAAEDMGLPDIYLGKPLTLIP